jgi:hypothetical protein
MRTAIMASIVAPPAQAREAMTLVGYDRVTWRFAFAVTVPLGSWSAARQIANVPATTPICSAGTRWPMRRCGRSRR